MAENEFMFLISTFVPKGCIGAATHGDVDVAAQGALLHISITHA